MLSNRGHYIGSIFNEDNLAQKYSVSKKPQPKVNSNALTSNQTELAGCFYAQQQYQMFTVDNNSLVR